MLYNAVILLVTSGMAILSAFEWTFYIATKFETIVF